MKSLDVNSLLLFLSGILVVAAVYDLRYQKIPNLLTFPTMLLALTYYCFTKGMGGFLFSMGGLFLGMGMLIVFYIMGGMGAGDVKLLGAVGAVLGPQGALVAFVLTVIIGGVYGILLILLNYSSCRAFVARLTAMVKTFLRTRQLVYIPAPEGENKPKLCYGIPIALGSFSTIGLLLSDSELLLGFNLSI